jgi:release factor glutamine methyltransferase
MKDDHAQIYPPSEDTFLLAAAALAEVRPTDRVLEIGTGSGYIAGFLQEQAERVVATEINPHAALAAHKRGVEVVRTDLARGICGKFDLILFNPPYLPTQPEERVDDWFEYALDGGKTGRAAIERFSREAGFVLAPDGRILLLVSSLTGIVEVFALFQDKEMKAGIVRSERLEDGETLHILRIIRA